MSLINYSSWWKVLNRNDLKNQQQHWWPFQYTTNIFQLPTYATMRLLREIDMFLWSVTWKYNILHISQLENLKFYILSWIKITTDKIAMMFDHVLSILMAPYVVVLSGGVSEEESNKNDWFPQFHLETVCLSNWYKYR